jgi:hypothetical protein
MSKARIGGYGYNQELTRIRNAANAIQDALRTIFEGNPGPQTIIALAGRIAFQITIILDATAKLKDIGQEAKKERTDQ